MLLFFQNQTYIKAISIGILSALTYLTKASNLPMLAIFLTMIVIQNTYLFLKKRLNLRSFITKALVYPCIIITSFLVVSWPYLYDNKIKYKSYLFNVNTTYYMWIDSWKDRLNYDKICGERLNWPNCEHQNKLPSLNRYIRTKTVYEVIKRVGYGIKMILKNSIIRNYGYTKYLIIFSVAILIQYLKAIKNKQLNEIMFDISQNLFEYIFITVVPAVNIALFVWWMAIANGRRFFLTIFMTLLFLLIYIYQRKEGEKEKKLLLLGIVPFIIFDVLTVYFRVQNHNCGV